MDKIQIESLIISCLHQLLSETYQNENNQIPVLNGSTRLIGKGAFIGSVGLVSLIVDVEEKLNDNYGISITIADERAMSQEKSPFLTVETLSEYITLLVKEQL